MFAIRRSQNRCLKNTTSMATTVTTSAKSAIADRRPISFVLRQAVRIVNLRTTAVGVRPPFDLAALAPRGGSLEAAARGNRSVWFDGGWQATKIWDRMSLPVGTRPFCPPGTTNPDPDLRVISGVAPIVLFPPGT